MAKEQTTTLTVFPRSVEGSRATRRLRREGKVPGVLYGRGGDPLPLSVDARDLRLALQATGAVIELTLDGKSTPAVLKEVQRHQVRGETTHVDFLRVDLSKPIHAIVPLELTGGDDAPGVREGGILDQQLRELNIEALPNDIPESIELDVSGLEIGGVAALEGVSLPAGVTLLEDLETVVAAVLAPRLRAEDEEGIEQETAVVGEAPASAEGGEELEPGE
ncbi:MAG: 50S ribosomal protein L25 [Solirubrobacteraceae bacterium]|nr:50S ribosomal protein L25 [Solirubrobacteraceae bacterium]